MFCWIDIERKMSDGTCASGEDIRRATVGLPERGSPSKNHCRWPSRSAVVPGKAADNSCTSGNQRWAISKARRRWHRRAVRRAGTKSPPRPVPGNGWWGARRGRYGNQSRRRRPMWRRRRRWVTWPWPVVTSAGSNSRLPRPATATIPIVIMQMSSNNNAGRSTTAAATTTTTSPAPVPRRKRRTVQYSPTRWPARRACTRTPETNRTRTTAVPSTWWWIAARRWVAAAPGERPPPATRRLPSSSTGESSWTRPTKCSRSSPTVSRFGLGLSTGVVWNIFECTHLDFFFSPFFKLVNIIKSPL